MKTVNKP